MPPEGPPGTDAFRERIWCSLQAAQKEGSGQGAARFLIVSILKSRIPGRAAMPSAGHGAILRFRSKKSGRIRAFRLQISSQNCQNSAPPEAPCCTLHFVLRFPVIPPDVLSALALLHPAQDLGARSRIPFLLLRQVCDVRQIPGFRRRRTPFPAGKVSLIEGSHRLLHLRYFLREP